MGEVVPFRQPGPSLAAPKTAAELHGTQAAGAARAARAKALDDTQPDLGPPLEPTGAAAGWAFLVLAFAAGFALGLLAAGAGMLWLVLP